MYCDNFTIDFDEKTFNSVDIYNKLKQTGIILIKNYYNQKDIFELQNNFDLLFEKVIPFIETAENLNNDRRIFNANNYVDFDIFANNKLFSDITTLYFSDHVKSYYSKNDFSQLYPMANILKYNSEYNSNSGGTWHRDNHFGMIKTMLYLTDCYDDNGCLQFLTNSSIDHISIPQTSHKINKRYNDDDIDIIRKTHTNIELLNIIGKAGTIIILDASYIHRGNIIKSGQRNAITLYPYECK